MPFHMPDDLRGRARGDLLRAMFPDAGRKPADDTTGFTETQY
jgi:hypothetical protein